MAGLRRRGRCRATSSSSGSCRGDGLHASTMTDDATTVRNDGELGGGMFDLADFSEHRPDAGRGRRLRVGRDPGHRHRVHPPQGDRSRSRPSSPSCGAAGSTPRRRPTASSSGPRRRAPPRSTPTTTTAWPWRSPSWASPCRARPSSTPAAWPRRFHLTGEVLDRLRWRPDRRWASPRDRHRRTGRVEADRHVARRHLAARLGLEVTSTPGPCTGPSPSPRCGGDRPERRASQVAALSSPSTSTSSRGRGHRRRGRRQHRDPEAGGDPGG